MKLFSQHGLKVLEAPIESEHAYPSFQEMYKNKGINKLNITLEIYTTARDTQYIILLDHNDIAELRKILGGT